MLAEKVPTFKQELKWFLEHGQTHPWLIYPNILKYSWGLKKKEKKTQKTKQKQAQSETGWGTTTKKSICVSVLSD